MISPETQQVIDYLKDNLTINIDSSEQTDYGANHKYVTVRLYLNGEEISSDTTSI